MVSLFSCFNLASPQQSALAPCSTIAPCVTGCEEITRRRDRPRILEFKGHVSEDSEDDQLEDCVVGDRSKVDQKIWLMEAAGKGNLFGDVQERCKVRSQKQKEQEERREQKRVLESRRLEQDRKKREEREHRFRAARSKSADARRRQREGEDRHDQLQKLNKSAELATQKLVNDIEGDWSIQADVTEPACGNEAQTLILPVASIKDGVLTWAPRLNRQGNFLIGFETGGVLSLVDGCKPMLGTLDKLCSGTSNDDAFYKLRWNNGDIWVKAPDIDDHVVPEERDPMKSL